MYSKSESLLIKRFLFSKKTDGYISVFSWFSIIGISLGVGAIIIVMSVMNGFRENLTERLLGINSHLNIYPDSSLISIDDINFLKNNIKKNKYKQIIESIETQGLIINNNISRGVLIRGYNKINHDHYLHNKIVKGNLFNNNFNEIIIGDSIANLLKVSVGDELKIAIPKTDNTILGNIPRFKTLKIIGIFDFGLYEYDSNLVFISYDLARRLLLIDDNYYNQIEFYLDDHQEVDKIKNEINNIIDKNNLDLYSFSWKDKNSSLINALNVEKNVMFLILSLIIFVASMNIISGLIIFVKEKNKDIGILKTLGMTNKSIVKIFFSIGIIIGIIGASLGVIIGVVFTVNLEYVQKILENLLNTKLFAEEIYYLSSLPSDIKIEEIVVVYFTSLLISILSTIFPALRSAKIDPINSIRNE